MLNLDNILHLFVLTFCLVLDTFIFLTQIPRDFREGPGVDFPFSFVWLHRLQQPVQEARAGQQNWHLKTTVDLLRFNKKRPICLLWQCSPNHLSVTKL